MDRDNNDEAAAAPATADSRLKTIARYAMLAFAPVLSVVALVVAVIAITGNQSQSDRSHLSELTTRVDGLYASLSEAKGELDNLKFAMARDKAMRGDERKKSDELDAKIIQNVTRLQTKSKVAPTLEDQLREPVSTPAAIPAVTSAASAPVAAPAPVMTDKKPVAAAPVLKGGEKSASQTKALKDAIEKFNKK